MKLIKSIFTCTECGTNSEEHELLAYGNDFAATIEATLATIRSILVGKCMVCEYRRREAAKNENFIRV